MPDTSPVTRNELLANKARKRMARFVAGTLALLLLLVAFGGVVVYRQGQDNERTQREVARILENTERRDKEAKETLARFVAETNTATREALDEHDRSTKVFLSKNLRLTEAEVNAPENQEDATKAPAPQAPSKSSGKGKKK